MPHSQRGAPSHGSGTHVRVEMLGDQLERISDKLDKMDLRAQASEIHAREQLVELKSSLVHVRAMLDHASTQHATLTAQVAAHGLRIDALESEEDKRRGGQLVAAGSGVVGGGLIAGLIKLIERLVS